MTPIWVFLIIAAFASAWVGATYRCDLKWMAHILSKEETYRKALLRIGAQHPAWSTNPDDQLVHMFNRVTATAREAVGAVGADDDAKADWCTNESIEAKAHPTDIGTNQ